MAAHRVHLTADFEHRDETGHRIFSAGVRTLPPAALAAAQAAGLVQPAPASPKAAPKPKPAPAKAAAAPAKANAVRARKR
ncbi:MAG TPA: hypothetical protein VFH92_02490 [Phenylobacterium sp.]|nr:hypothetical protein [Phenylobacterium sp.]